MDKVFLAGCYLVSCFICIYITLQFMEERFCRTYRSNVPYVATCVGVSVFMAGINLLDNVVMNVLTWITIVALCAVVLYRENAMKTINRIIESEAIFLTIIFTETLGVIVVGWIIQVMEIQIVSQVIRTCIDIMFSKLVIVFFYYMVVRYFITDHDIRQDKKRYFAFFVFFLYSLIHMMVIVTGLYKRLDAGIVAINLSCIVFVDLYMLSFLKSADEKKQYDEKVKMLEQQAKLQYEYYVQQERKHNEMLRILHDVNRHIQTINELAMTGDAARTKDYAEQIRDTLKPLIPVTFTDNPILNILLSDKLQQTKDKGIEMEIDMDGVSFNFMEAIDITTIFGNLLDNAIEACEAIDGRIVLTARMRQEMVAVTLRNSTRPVKWKGGAPVSEKGENRGIGLLNVQKSIDKYDGDLKLGEEAGEFVTEFFLNI